MLVANRFPTVTHTLTDLCYLATHLQTDPGSITLSVFVDKHIVYFFVHRFGLTLDMNFFTRVVYLLFRFAFTRILR